MTKTEKKPKTKDASPATKLVERMYRNRVALSDEIKSQVVGVLQERLAEATDMHSQAKFAHWNVKGVNFYQLHLVFDHVAKVIGKQIDPIAERLTQLGGVANGTIRQAAMSSKIPEYPVETINGMDHVRALADALGHYCQGMRRPQKRLTTLVMNQPQTFSTINRGSRRTVVFPGIAPRGR